jgi:hypothetical protein
VLINSNGTFDANDRTNTVTGLATVSGGEYQTKSGDHAFNGGLTISGGVFTGGTADITLTDLTLTSGTLIIPSGSFSLTGNWSKTGGTFTPGTNFVSFDGSGTQTLNSGGSSFYNLTHTGSGTLQLSTNNLAVTGIFSNNASAGTFNANGLTNTVTGLTTVSGGTYQASTATQTFNGGLIVSGGVFMGSSGTVDVNGNLTLSAGTLTAPSGNLNVSGNWTHSAGTFNHNNGTVNLDGVNQSIVGSNTFNNLLKIISTSETLTFDDGSPQTIAGTLTLQGQADQLLFLRSNLSASQWLIDIQGGMNLTYLDVMDSQVIGSLADCSLGCIDSGNNIRWNFLEVSPTEQQDILLGVAPENTKRAHYNSSVIFIEGKKNDPQSIKGYLMTYGRHWGGIYGRWMEHIVEANQALSRPWGFELLPMVYMGGGNIQ